MAASATDIRGWFDQGVEMGATHMIVVCDTFEWDDYPVYVARGDDLAAKIAEHDGTNMQKIMEVYALWKPRGPQMMERRVYDTSPAPDNWPLTSVHGVPVREFTETEMADMMGDAAVVEFYTPGAFANTKLPIPVKRDGAVIGYITSLDVDPDTGAVNATCDIGFDVAARAVSIAPPDQGVSDSD